MSYCCICGRETNHPKSYHCKIEDDIYHYCNRHSYIGKRLVEKDIVRRVCTKERIEFWKEVKRKYL